MDQMNYFKYSPEKKDSPKAQYHTTVVPYNKKAPPLEGTYCKKIGDMCNLKHENSSPKSYELFIKI